MKILFTIKTLSIAGGAEKVLCNLASELINKGNEVYVITNDKSDISSFYPVDFRIKRININYTNHFFNNIILLLKTRLYIKDIKPDCIIAFMISSYILTLLSTIKLNIPVYASEHTTYKYYENRLINKLLLFIFLNKYKKVILVSSQAITTYPKFLQKNMIYINNPVDNLSYSKKTNLIDNEDKKNILISVGRLCDSKNYFILIDVIDNIKNKIENWELHIYGDGELRTEILKYIKFKNLENRIFLKGQVLNIYDVLNNAQIFVTTSQYESIGLSVLEAVNIGLPTIAFKNCTGLNTIIKNNYNGILVDGLMNSSQLFSIALLSLIQNSKLRIQFSENCKLDQNYSISKISENWVNLLNSQNV